MSDRWYEIANVEELPSPALIVYEERIQQNVRRMIEMVGDATRLRPHIKTHKIPELIAIQLDHGITKFKCATVAEAEMAANAGAPDMLVAYQLVGPNIARFISLCQKFPRTKFSCVVDNPVAIGQLSKAAAAANIQINVFLDLDIGQNRTGVAPGRDAHELYGLIAHSPNLLAAGLHAYDGHIHHTDVTQRAEACEAAFAPVTALRQKLEQDGLPVPTVVAGGTPTFPMHARRRDVECSPGTCVFWDAGYAHKVPDLPFVPAAVLLTRVVSKPTPNRLCLDLGHKAVASEMPHPRVVFLNLQNPNPVVHSEEHLVLETPEAAAFQVGDVFYGIPWHVCPTVALHNEVAVARKGRVHGHWQVTARARALTI